MSKSIQFEFIRSLELVAPEDWQSLVKTDYPFIRYEFLKALESSGSVNANSGWQPMHLIGKLEGKLCLIMPMYLKTHSYGEYVFDFQWANAYHQSGIAYYPKLLSAIPFTPCSGTRITHNLELSDQAVFDLVVAHIKLTLSDKGIESFHLLFPNSQDSNEMKASGLMQRLGIQYHWQNHGYLSFDDFLARCNKKHRNNIKRERKQVSTQGVEISWLQGLEISPEIWESFYLFYQLTYAKRSGHGGYLNREFFCKLGETMPEQCAMVVAQQNGEMVAAALFLSDAETLYGRYWGCRVEFDKLHFELCYYQAIEYAISKGLSRIDAGAQGEHKIQRGFEPVITYSNHWICHPDFRRAIQEFLERETSMVHELRADACRRLPFKRDLPSS